MNYLNCSSQYFFTNNKDKNAILENDKDLQERIFNLQSILEEIYNKKEVSYIEFYNTDTGNESSIEEYKEVNWNITDFSKKFFEAMIQNSGFTPTIKVVFKK